MTTNHQPHEICVKINWCKRCGRPLDELINSQAIACDGLAGVTHAKYIQALDSSARIFGPVMKALLNAPRELDREFNDEERFRIRAYWRQRLSNDGGLTTFIEFSDEWVAFQARNLVRNDLWHEPIVQAASQRIMKLSIELETMKQEVIREP